jgi:hypothetical protein
MKKEITEKIVDLLLSVKEEISNLKDLLNNVYITSDTQREFISWQITRLINLRKNLENSLEIENIEKR